MTDLRSERTDTRRDPRRACIALLLTLMAGHVLRAQQTLTVMNGDGTSSAMAVNLQAMTQQPANQQFSGSVNGRVLCGDTQRPARFAQVALVPVSSVTGGSDAARSASGRTDLDGGFQINSVAPGDYYLVAGMAGYVSEGALIQAGVAAGGDLNQLLGTLPTVRVTTGSATAGITLQRGGTIAGSVQWEDGVAAAGVSVNVLPATTSSIANTTTGAGSGYAAFARNSNNVLGGSAGRAVSVLSLTGPITNSLTDDQGHFRLTGLAPGEYLVRAVVQTPPPSGSSATGFGSAMGSTLITYAPGKPRQTEASSVVIRGTEERNDVQITIPFNSLHTVTGHVGAAGSTSVTSGVVRLQDQADSSLQRLGIIGADGNFIIQWVPAGNYALTANGSAQASGGNRTRSSGSATTFQPYQSAITVADGDLTDLSINLTASPSTGSQ